MPRVASLPLITVALAISFGATAATGSAQTAKQGDLQFGSVTPQAGSTVRITYHAPPSLSAQPTLFLRGRYRTARRNTYSEPPYTEGTIVVTAATLERRGDGTFVGSWMFPDSVVYAAFAVANAAATTVDDRGGRYWEILAHGSDARPLLQSLDQQIADNVGRSIVGAVDAARRMAQLYPERPVAVRRHWLFESIAGGAAREDSINAVFVGKFRELDTRFHRDTALGRRRLGEMAGFAYQLLYGAKSASDSALLKRWITRAVEETPTAPGVLAVRGYEVYYGHKKDPAAALREFDAIWRQGADSLSVVEAGWQPRRGLAGSAYRVAQLAKDTLAFRRWSERLADGGRYARRRMAAIMIDVASARALAMEWIRDELGVVNAMRAEHRFLGETVRQHERRRVQEERQLLTLLGRALVASGQIAAGLDTLSRAAEGGWDVELFRDIANARMLANDTSGAVAVLAKIAVDPRTSESFIDSAAALAAPLGAQRWTHMLSQARAELPQRVLSTSTSTPVEGEVRIADAQGRAHTVRELSHGNITFILYWSKDCPDSRRELPLADSVAVRLAASGVRVLSVTMDAPSAAVNTLVSEKKLSFPVYYDSHKDVQRAFNHWGTPGYIVLDASGRMRYLTTDSPDGVLVQVEALRREQDLIQ